MPNHPVQYGIPIGTAPQSFIGTGDKLSAVLSDGRVVHVVPHAYDGKLYVYVMGATRTDIITQPMTISDGRATSSDNANNFSDTVISVAPDDSISVAYVIKARTLVRYCKINTSTWTATAWEQVATGSGQFTCIDMDVSDAGIPYISYNYYTGSNVTQLQVRSKPAAAWVTTYAAQIQAGALTMNGESAAIVCMNRTDTTRGIVLAHGSSSTTKDGGVVLRTMRVNETTGANLGLVSHATYFAGDVMSSASTVKGRLTKLFRSGARGFVLAVMHNQNSKRYGVITGGYNENGTYTHLVTAAHTASWAAQSTMGIVWDTKHVTFVAGSSFDGFDSTILKFSASDTLVPAPSKSFSTYNFVYSSAPKTLTGISSGGSRNAALARNDLVYMTAGGYQTNQWTFGFVWTGFPDSGENYITDFTPANGAEVRSANPDLRVTVEPTPLKDTHGDQSMYRAHWQFATDPTFTTNWFVYDNSPSWTFADYNSSQNIIADKLPSNYTLVGEQWYFRVRLENEYGDISPWSDTRSFTIAHPPNAVPISPKDGQLYVWNGAGEVALDWRFTDPSATDYQTAYQVNVYASVDGTATLVYDSGRIESSAQRAIAIIPPEYKEGGMIWQVVLWDSEDTIGHWSTGQFFILTDPPSAQIISPTFEETFDTGVPLIRFSASTGGLGPAAREIREYTVTISQGGIAVWSKRVPGPFPTPPPANDQPRDPIQAEQKIPQGYLQDGQSYSVQVTVVDSSGMIGASPLVPFTVDWIPPAEPTGVVVDDAPYNIDDEGYVSIQWDDTAREEGFAGWIVYRKVDMIDPESGVVLSEGNLIPVFAEYDIGEYYEYKDFFAPSNHRVGYLIRQQVNRDGQDMDSANTTLTTVLPKSDGYWLIEPTSDNADADAFKLSIVTGDSYVDEQEEAEFVVIGRGRVANKGEHLGKRGTLEAQLRNTGGTTARQKRVRLEQIQKVDGQLWMRDPFGDSFTVNVSAMTVTRVAGVGANEFCNVTIPYAAVAAK